MKNFIIILLLNFNLVQGQVKLLSYGTETFNPNDRSVGRHMLF